MNTHEYFQPGIGYLILCEKCAILRGYGKGFLVQLDETPGKPCAKCSETVMVAPRWKDIPVWERPCEEITREGLQERQAPYSF